MVDESLVCDLIMSSFHCFLDTKRDVQTRFSEKQKYVPRHLQ